MCRGISNAFPPTFIDIPLQFVIELSSLVTRELVGFRDRVNRIFMEEKELVRIGCNIRSLTVAPSSNSPGSSDLRVGLVLDYLWICSEGP